MIPDVQSNICLHQTASSGVLIEWPPILMGGW